MYSRSTQFDPRSPWFLNQTPQKLARTNQQKFESEVLTAIDRHDSTRGENVGASQLDRLRVQVQAAKANVMLSVRRQFGESLLPEMRHEILQAIDTVTGPVEALLRIHAAFASAKIFLDQWSRAALQRPAAEVDACLTSLAQAASPDVVRLLPRDLRKYLEHVEWEIAHERHDCDKQRLYETLIKTCRTLDDHLRRTKLDDRAAHHY
jgi:hypothetical protein